MVLQPRIAMLTYSNVANGTPNYMHSIMIHHGKSGFRLAITA